MPQASPPPELPVTDRAAITQVTLIGILVLSLALIAVGVARPELMGLTRGQVLAISAVDIILTGGFAALPWARLYATGVAQRLAGAYVIGLATLPIVAVLVGVDPAARMVWFAPLVVSFSALIAGTAVHVTVTLMMLGLLWLATPGADLTVYDLTLQASVIVTISLVGGVTAVLRRRSFAREAVYRADAERRAELLSGIGAAAARLTVEGNHEILRTLTTTARSLGADLVAVWLGDDPEPAALDGREPDPEAKHRLADLAQHAEETVRVDDGMLDDEHVEVHAATGLASLLVVPIVAGGERVGVFLCGARKPSAFTDEQVETIEMVVRGASPGLRYAGHEVPDDQEVLALLSHELRAPVTAIAGLTETIEARWRDWDDDLRRTLLGRVRANATALDLTLGAMRSLVRLEREDGRFAVAPVDVGALVGRTLDRLEPVLAEHPVRRDVQPVPRAAADEALLERVLENLLTNARRHTPPGTSIGVSVAPVREGVEVSVTDDGPGIETSAIAQLRSPYARGPKSPGLGIGLSLCDRILRRMGSELRIDSAADRGSRFSFVLPTAEA